MGGPKGPETSATGKPPPIAGGRQSNKRYLRIDHSKTRFNTKVELTILHSRTPRHPAGTGLFQQSLFARAQPTNETDGREAELVRVKEENKKRNNKK